MQWVRVFLPRQVADQVGATAVRAGVGREQAIATALWMFGQLEVHERAALIRAYLADSGVASPAQRRATGA